VRGIRASLWRSTEELCTAQNRSVASGVFAAFALAEITLVVGLERTSGIGLSTVLLTDA
jgi:hypothetical protein